MFACMCVCACVHVYVCVWFACVCVSVCVFMCVWCHEARWIIKISNPFFLIYLAGFCFFENIPHMHQNTPARLHA